MKIMASETPGCRKGPEAWFTGEVWLDEIVTGGAPARLKATRVTFAPGALTAWHAHPPGQALHVVSGWGWVQRKDDAAQVICAGDSVWIEPGELHWHGAATGKTMVHLAMQNATETEGGQSVDVVWLEHVADAEYMAAASE